MKRCLIYPAGTTPATTYAVQFLGLPTTDRPTDEVTHLLLDVPTHQSIDGLLAQLPSDVTVIGGNLHLPEQPCLDLLLDEAYLAENAAITAHCAIKLALPQLSVTLSGCPVLIMGWGRIGKCLGQLLRALGAEVTIAARNPSHRAMLKALGYQAVDYPQIPEILEHFRLLYNTVPVKILSESVPYPETLVAIELSSLSALPGKVIDGRRLPGRLAPESAGRLIAETILRRI